MQGRTRRDGTSGDRGRTRARWLLAFGMLAFGGLLTAATEATAAPSYAAAATIAPKLYYVGDSTGSVYTFTVKNTGTTTSIGAVEINRPTNGWQITSCPTKPTGWVVLASSTKCRYRSALSKTDDIKPGQSKTFGVKAKTDPGSANRTGTWTVVVSSSNHFNTPSLLKAASAYGAGLSTRLYTFELTTAVVSSTLKVPGTLCPPANKTAILGSTQHIVVCGKNRSTTALKPVATYSALGGTFIKTKGTLVSATIPKNSANVVLADWSGTVITDVYGTAKKVIAGVGASANRTSPLRTFTGYSATSQPPVGVNDVYSTAEDTNLVTTAANGVLDNDSDPENDTLSVTNLTQPSNGTLTMNAADGSFTYDPNPDFHGTDSFTYTVNDTHSDSAVTTVTITVNPVNDAPVGADDTKTTNEDTAASVDVLDNDSDVDGNALVVSAVDTTGTTGTVTNNGTDVTYDPNGQFEGLTTGQTATDTFTYTASDGNGGTDTQTVTVTITGVNDAPVAVDDAASTDEASTVLVDVDDNDSDTENAFTVTSVDTTGTAGTVTNNNDGTVTYDPAGAFEHLGNGEDEDDTFTYTVTDGNGGTDTATVTVDVNGINDAPVAVSDAATVGEDSSGATVNVLGNDTDAESQTLTVTGIDTTGTTGTVTNNGTDVTYDPDGQFESLTTNTATDTFTYTVTDSQGGTDTETVTITIQGSNDAPLAVDDAAATDEATQVVVSVLTNDSDTEGALTVTAIGTTGTAGTVTNNLDGTVTYDPNGAFEHLGNGEDEDDTFTYTVTDGTGATDTATVTVDVNGINDAPVAVSDAANVGEDSTGATVNVLGNDTDAESQTLTVTGIDTTGTSGTVTNNGTDVTYDPNGMFEYLDDTETATDTFTYTVTDSQGGSDTATVTVTVNGANDAPVAADDGPFQTFTNQNVMLTVPGVLANDTDADGEALTAGNASDPAHGTVTLNPDGSFSYAPDTGYNGTDSFTYDVSDGTLTDTATVSLTVVPPNATPTADATSASGNEDGGAIVVTLTGHDADGDALTFGPGTATNGLVTVAAGVSCDANVPSLCTATVTYTPNANFNGSDSFTYTVNDGTLDSAPATATITVNPVNDEPSFTKGAGQTVNEDAGAQTVNGWATAISAGPANEAAQAVSFTVTNNNNGLFSAQPAVSPSGELTYTPAPDANGVATVSVNAADDGGTANGGDDASPVQTFTITVGAVNDAPSFTKGADQTLNEDAGAQSVSSWAAAISKGPADESAQTLSFTTSNDNNALFSLQPGLTPTGTLTYTPATNAVGTATVTVYLSDTGGTANGGDDTSDSQTFTITVNAINDAPSFTTAGNQTVLEDAGAQTVNGFVTSTTAGPADESAQAVTVAVVSNDNSGLFSAQPTITNGVLTYTPAADKNGSATVTVKATDDGGTLNGGNDTSLNQQFTITVTAVNDAPSFTKGADQTLNEDAGAQSVSGWATALSKGPADEAAQTLSFTVTNDNNALFVTQPAVSPAGALTYTSAANKYGTATVSVAIVDNGGTANNGDDTSDVQTFTITVNPVNDAPVAAAKAFTVQANMKISLGGLLTGATDPNDTSQEPSYAPTYTLGSITPGASCIQCTISNVDNANGTFDFEPPPGGTGTYSITYTVVDSGYPAPGATSAAQTTTFTVNGPVIWFADANNGNDTTGNGTLARPFQTLTAVAGVDAANQHVYLAQGTYSTAYTLNNGAILGGSGAKATNFDTLYGVTPPAGTIARPTINTTSPSLSGGITLGSGNTVRGVTMTGSSGTGLAGNNFGTLTLGSGAGADVAFNRSAQALSLNSGTVNGDFLSTTSSAGADNVNLTNVQTTTSTSLGTGALSGASDDALEINGQNGTFSYAGTLINAAAGDALAVLNKSGGTVTIAGPVSDTSGTGVTLTSNTGSVINLTGGVTLNTGTGNAFAATGGGTVSVTGATNTITTTTGTALNIANTTIGAADVTFRSITANGAANGIVLNTTGSTGNLVVTGTGAAATGGTISNTTGNGVSLTSTRDVAFSHLRVQNSGGDGISASTVTNLSLTSVEVLGAGDADEERALDMVNVGGTVTINDGTYDDASDDLVKLKNTNLNATVTVSNTATFSNQTHVNAGNAFDFAPDGSSVFTVSITGSTFSNLKNTSVNFGATTAGSNGTSSLTFSNNGVSGGAGGAGGVTVSGQESSTTNVTIANNTFTGAGGNGVVNHDVNDDANVRSTITGNTFTSPKGHAIVGAVDENGDIRMNVTNNQISNAGGDGIQLTNFGDDSAAAMTSTAHFLVTNNTVNGHSQTNGVQFVGGIGIFHFEADADTTCSKVSGNTVTGTNAAGGFSDIYLQDDSNAANRMTFEESPNTAATGDASSAYIHSLNPGTTFANVNNLGASLSDGATCALP